MVLGASFYASAFMPFCWSNPSTMKLRWC